MNLIRSLTFKDNVWYCWHLAGTNIYIRRTGSLWQSFYRQIPWTECTGTYTGPSQEEPESAAAFNNAAWNGKTAILQIGFPEKPFLLNLGGITLYPGMELFLELQLPPAFCLLPGESEINMEQSEILFNYVPFFLKDAWFGKDTMRGDIYSSLPASFLPSANASLGIYCALQIRNHFKTTLELNRVPLYTDTLGIYEQNGKIISDKPVIDVFGDDFRETIIKEQGTLLAPPVVKTGVGDTLIRRGTQMIKKIARYK